MSAIGRCLRAPHQAIGPALPHLVERRRAAGDQERAEQRVQRDRSASSRDPAPSEYAAAVVNRTRKFRRGFVSVTKSPVRECDFAPSTPDAAVSVRR